MSKPGFVKTKGTLLERDGKPYFIVGTNFWHGMNLGCTEEFGGDRARLDRELDLLQESGHNCLRIMVMSEGPSNQPFRMKPPVMEKPGQFNEQVLVGLDYFVDGIAKRGMTCIATLNNQWHWSGGLAQYVAWAEGLEAPPSYPPSWDLDANAYTTTGSFDDYAEYGIRFYKDPKVMDKCQEMWQDAITHVITRINTINGKPYAEDTCVMAWELCNEPQYQTIEWVDKSAKFIKGLAPKQLCFIGNESKWGQVDFMTNESKYTDATTLHAWCENWQVYKPENANDERELSKAITFAHAYMDFCSSMSAGVVFKPFIMEEAGMARDAHLGPKYSKSTSVTNRDKYFGAIYKKGEELMKKGRFSGFLYWSWGGEGDPQQPLNKFGVRWMGDPHHEAPVWYSVFSTDTSTLAVIRKHADNVAKIVAEMK